MIAFNFTGGTTSKNGPAESALGGGKLTSSLKSSTSSLDNSTSALIRNSNGSTGNSSAGNAAGNNKTVSAASNTSGAALLTSVAETHSQVESLKLEMERVDMGITLCGLSVDKLADIVNNHQYDNSFVKRMLACFNSLMGTDSDKNGRRASSVGGSGIRPRRASSTGSHTERTRAHTGGGMEMLSHNANPMFAGVGVGSSSSGVGSSPTNISGSGGGGRRLAGTGSYTTANRSEFSAVSVGSSTSNGGGHVDGFAAYAPRPLSIHDDDDANTMLVDDDA